MDINLNIYDETGTKHLGREYLFFGKALHGTFDGWDWVEKQGMKVDGPWAFDEGATKSNTIVLKSQLIQWISDGYLSTAHADGYSLDFLDKYPSNAIFNLWFVDF